MSKAAVSSNLPMRFKTALPEDFSLFSTEQQKIYMQLSDSDDDDMPDRVAKVVRRTVVSTGKNAPKKGAKGAEVTFKHERPTDRERPLSAKVLHSVAANDSEFKVSNDHCVPLVLSFIFGGSLDRLAFVSCICIRPVAGTHIASLCVRIIFSVMSYFLY